MKGCRARLNSDFAAALSSSDRAFDVATKKRSVDGFSHCRNAPVYRRLTKRNVHILPNSTLVGAPVAEKQTAASTCPNVQ